MATLSPTNAWQHSENFIPHEEKRWNFQQNLKKNRHNLISILMSEWFFVRETLAQLAIYEIVFKVMTRMNEWNLQNDS